MKQISQDDVMREYLMAEMSKFRFAGELKSFVSNLTPAQALLLGNMLSNWRGNGMHGVISNKPNWLEESVSIEKIVVGPINAEVNPLLNKHGNRLASIVSDDAIRNHPEFKDQGTILFSRFMAVRTGDNFILRDGIHRAIRMALNGETAFTLIVPE